MAGLSGSGWGEVRAWLRAQGCDLAEVADLSGLPAAKALGFSRGVLFGRVLSPAFIRRTRERRPGPDEYLEREEWVEQLADRLAERITQAGSRARSQSERSNLDNGCAEGGLAQPGLRCGPSPVPQKTLARLAGLGFVGKNNLLVTPRWGCALVLCSVLTDAPFPAAPANPVAGGCGSCRACVDACPEHALSGESWSLEAGREGLLNISRCRCPLACMMACPRTLRYAGL